MSDNKESIEVLKSRMEAFAENQKREFVEEVSKIKSFNAAQGKFKSGGTIKEICKLIEKFLNQRADEYKKVLDTLNLKPSKELSNQLYSIKETYFDKSYPDFSSEYEKIIELISPNESAVATTDDMIKTSIKTVSERAALDIQQELMKLKEAPSNSISNRVFLVIEVLLLLITAFLAGMWAVDKNGNYEPFIVLTAAVSGFLEIARRYTHAKA